MKQIHRIFGFDLIKAVAMFLIVFYHLGSLDFGLVPTDGWYVPNLTKIFYAFCSAGVPLFFMVNGALQGEKQMSLDKCAMKSARLVLVAVIWSTLFTCILYPWLRGSDLPRIGEFLNYYWFLYTLAALYWISFVLNRFHYLKVITVALLFVFPFSTNLCWDVYLAFHPQSVIPSWGHTGVFTLYCVVYYYLGAYLYKRDLPKIRSIVLTLMGLLLVNGEVIVMSTHYQKVYDGVNSCFPTLGAMFVSSGLFSLLKQVRFDGIPFVRTVVSHVGSNTIGIYILHLFFLWLIRDYHFHGVIQNLFVVVFGAIIVILITTYMSAIIRVSPFRFLLKL